MLSNYGNCFAKSIACVHASGTAKPTASLDILGSAAFKPVKSDMTGNIKASTSFSP